MKQEQLFFLIFQIMLNFIIFIIEYYDIYLFSKKLINILMMIIINYKNNSWHLRS